jgi:hypothetical protein
MPSAYTQYAIREEKREKKRNAKTQPTQVTASIIGQEEAAGACPKSGARNMSQAANNGLS